MSFMMTTAQMIARTKWVTRRHGWGFLMPKEIVQAVEKSQGLGKGGKIVKLHQIKITSTRHERLNRMTLEPEYGRAECIAEGFPDMSPEEFVDFFCRGHKKCKPSSHINRIEFSHQD
jgi:hypothetical protein